MGEVASGARPSTCAQNQVLAVGYTRVSTAEQTAGHSLETQRQAIREHCLRNGWQLVATLEDVQSGKSTRNRPELRHAVQMCKTGEAQVLVAAKLDRLSRSLLDFSKLVDQAQRQHWSLVCVDQDFDLNTPAGRAMAGMLAVFAQFEREVIGQRVREGLQAAKANGVRLGRPRTLPTKTRRWIREQRDQGHTYAAIAEALDQAGIPTAHGGQHWHPSTIRTITSAHR